jgi:cytochrome c oxidase subunit II
LANPAPNPMLRPLSDGTVPESVVARTEGRWFLAMNLMLAIMMLVIVLTSAFGRARLSSHIEVVDPLTLQLGGEFAESNLGTALEADGSVTVRIIAQQFGFVPHCVQVPVDTPVTFRLTSADVVHGFLLPQTNVNTMVMPGFVSEVRSSFAQMGVYVMPCHEFCGLGHHGMWAQVRVVRQELFTDRDPLKRLRCAAR